MKVMTFRKYFDTCQKEMLEGRSFFSLGHLLPKKNQTNLDSPWQHVTASGLGIIAFLPHDVFFSVKQRSSTGRIHRNVRGPREELEIKQISNHEGKKYRKY